MVFDYKMQKGLFRPIEKKTRLWTSCRNHLQENSRWKSARWFQTLTGDRTCGGAGISRLMVKEMLPILDGREYVKIKKPKGGIFGSKNI